MIALPSPSGIVTLLTDFGETDQYVAAMKGVMLSLSPTLQLIDASHGVPPQSVETAAYLLREYAGTFPAGTVHLAVVDPGVGSEREALVAAVDEHLFVGPNNGFLSFVAASGTVVAVRRIDGVRLGLTDLSPTFHGRDLFAPVAALLAAGRLRLEEVGEATRLVHPQWEHPERIDSVWHGRVLHVDHFGNVITNLTRSHLGAAIVDRIVAGGCTVDRLVDYYAQASSGALIALFGSGDHLELSVVNGNAATYLGIGAGDPVTCHTRTDGL